jgi:hypothetical protein
MLSNLIGRPTSPGKNDRGAMRRTCLGVTLLEDRCVPTTIVVTGTGDTIALDGQVTLREAITAANTNRAVGDAPAGTPGLDIINFAIGTGQQTISLASVLPSLTERVTIDGTTQPGFTGKPIIQIVAPSVANTVGLTLLNSNSTVRGLVLNKFRTAISLQGGGSHFVAGNYIGTSFDGMSRAPSSTGLPTGVAVSSPNNIIGGAGGNGNLIAGQIIAIDISGSSNQVKGNLIGTDATGANKLGNDTGIYIAAGASRNRIGGTDFASDGRNVISGNAFGMDVRGSRNVIQGNFIGTDASGTVRLANESGMEVTGVFNLVGGTAPGAGNVISGNRRWGVHVRGSRNTVQGNRIGTDLSGTALLGNDFNGVRVNGSYNLIGGSLATAANTIYYNALAGVSVESGASNAIRRNSFFENGKLAISLSGSLVPEDSSINDDLDTDAGPNGLQNYPVLIAASNNYVEGVLNSRKNRSYIIDLYSSPTAANPESGQGTYYLRSLIVKTDAYGDAPFTFYLSQGVPTGYFLTATATTIANAPYGDTSEFSPVVEMEGYGGGSLTAASMAPSTSGAKLTAARAQSLLSEAVRRWHDSGVDTSALDGITIRVADLGGSTLGHAGRNTIWLDDNAAGWGWFVDQSPRNDSEFRAPGNQGEQKRMDLLSVLMHEVGHLLGRNHVASTASAPDAVMSETLTAGTRQGTA